MLIKVRIFILNGLFPSEGAVRWVRPNSPNEFFFPDDINEHGLYGRKGHVVFHVKKSIEITYHIPYILL